MTKEEIAELCRFGRAARSIANDVQIKTAHLARLLEERERLLAAAKIEPHCCGQSGVREDHEVIAAAIAFAEEPLCVP